MNYFQIFFNCLIFLFITACDTRVQTAPTEKTTEVKTTEVKTAPIATSTKASAEPQEIRQPLNLSISDISFEDKKNDKDIFVNDSDLTEKNSALFNQLSKKRPGSGVNLSGELLTDENADETQDIRQSVDGMQINVKGDFK